MSGLKGIAKNLTASFSSHLVAMFCSSFALTPLFLRQLRRGRVRTSGSGLIRLGLVPRNAGLRHTDLRQPGSDRPLPPRRHDGNFTYSQSTALRMLAGHRAAWLAPLFSLVFFLPRGALAEDGRQRVRSPAIPGQDNDSRRGLHPRHECARRALSSASSPDNSWCWAALTSGSTGTTSEVNASMILFAVPSPAFC